MNANLSTAAICAIRTSSALGTSPKGVPLAPTRFIAQIVTGRNSLNVHIRCDLLRGMLRPYGSIPQLSFNFDSDIALSVLRRVSGGKGVSMPSLRCNVWYADWNPASKSMSHYSLDSSPVFTDRKYLPGMAARMALPISARRSMS